MVEPRGQVRKEPGELGVEMAPEPQPDVADVSAGAPTSHGTPLPLPCPWRLVEPVLLPCYASVKPRLSLPVLPAETPEMDSDQASHSVGHLANDL